MHSQAVNQHPIAVAVHSAALPETFMQRRPSSHFLGTNSCSPSAGVDLIGSLQVTTGVISGGSHKMGAIFRLSHVGSAPGAVRLSGIDIKIRASLLPLITPSSGESQSVRQS
jgi:hypothetical protein